jgi:hypothetical protein
MLLFGREVWGFPKKVAASKTVYPEDGGTSCLQNHGTYLLHYMASHATTPQCWVTTMRTSNLYTKLCDYAWHMRFIMRYNMWGSHSAVHWWEFKSSEMWHCVIEITLPEFCWTMVPSLWGLGSPGRKLNPEHRGPTIAENVSNYTHNDTASHETLHSSKPQPWYKTSAVTDVIATSAVTDVIANMRIHIFWIATLTNNIIDSLLFQPTYCLLLQGLRSYLLTGNLYNTIQTSIYL